ncbi:CRISPR-associated endonuclease Cas3'' [Streptomyces albipurpureus]|uniref:CRISPR-associated endonuclease Cas3 n=1 Tax=Streptomyces albipurpureus TaxID=2897419 RepID=A0ABT0UWS8_9ACTN|nr:CRISPR-associated endonuclease Cas3'' [Streptomyces sp. CWNU-1]MCM2393034.1 CRISPR-associated endonuclease Cas3'' [Streptomyces sp. CWNU-1]
MSGTNFKGEGFSDPANFDELDDANNAVSPDVGAFSRDRRCQSSFAPEVSAPDRLPLFAVLWGKSEERAGGTTNLLISHLLDTAAVAERLWDTYLAPATKGMLDHIAGGERKGKGRAFFSWLCGVHDLGKATPAFQSMWPKGAKAVRAAGLGWNTHIVKAHPWRHDRAGAHLLRELLPQDGWQDEHIEWVWPLVAGHHGAFPEYRATMPNRRSGKHLVGQGQWPQVQGALLRYYTEQLGFTGIEEVQPVHMPSRAAQLHLSGLIVMADWIASDEKHFKGVDDFAKATFSRARVRAAEAWDELRLRGGWGQLAVPGPEVFADRFGHGPRPSQTLVLDAARRMEAPGLLVVEAPMGEGKTKAALMAAEILAARFGADGVFVGMPTQATSDPMFSNVRAWAGAIDEGLADRVALLHGKRMFNKEWRELLEGGTEDPDARFGSVDEFGGCWEDDEYGLTPRAEGCPQSRGPAEWFLGAKRGLLCPFVVGTIDQLLFAATRTKHVMLRMAGLAGKVVVLDEVHAADVYMSQFLKEGLRWLGQAGTPVVLLSATLPPAQRRELVDSYLAGAVSREEFTADELPEPSGYPSATAVWMAKDGSGPRYDVRAGTSWRADLQVTVELLPERIPPAQAPIEDREAALAEANTAVVELLRRELGDSGSGSGSGSGSDGHGAGGNGEGGSDGGDGGDGDGREGGGGCALVIRNTVERAQTLYTALREHFHDEVLLLHGRLAVAARADRTDTCLRLLGAPKGTTPRPKRLIVVATQLAEQSFDVDADLLITDLAPTDLLLQRVGRLHRHNGVTRPGGLTDPRVVITGFDHDAESRALPPRFHGGSEFIYGRHLLLRTAAQVLGTAAKAQPWSIPSQVPELVAACYDLRAGDADVSAGAPEDLIPPQWREKAEKAQTEWESKQRERAEEAATYLLTRRGDREGETLSGLHYAAVPGAGRDTDMDAVVRDGEPSVEVILIRHDGATYRTLSGRSLTVNGDVPDALLDDVLGGTVRLPPRYTEAAQQLTPLPGWLGHPRLRYSPALVLGVDHRSAPLADRILSYDQELGLVEERPIPATSTP